MKFDLMAVLVMIVAIAIGQWLGTYLLAYLGTLGSGIAGSLIVGLLIYVIYTFAAKQKFGVVHAIIFTVLIYVANLVAAWASGLVGITSGYMTLIFAGVIAAFLWGWVGAKPSGKGRKDGVKALKL
jgi:hypothetical protein